MSNIPEVIEASADNVRRNFERLGMQYVFDIIDDIDAKQPMITREIHDTLKFLREVLSKTDLPKDVVTNILDNLGYRMFAIIKSMYIQEEVNDLEEQAAIHVGTKNDQN